MEHNAWARGIRGDDPPALAMGPRRVYMAGETQDDPWRHPRAGPDQRND